MHYRNPQAQGLLRLGDAWRLQPTDELLRRLEGCLGRDAVQMDYEQNSQA
jgi:DNA polymerase-3 subunit alpha